VGLALCALIEQQARQAAAEAIASMPTPSAGIVINLPDRPEPITLDETAHELLPRVLALIGSGLPPLLVGPAGSGKTHLAKQAGRALGLETVLLSFSGGVTEAHVRGRVLPQANGAWEHVPSASVIGWRDGKMLVFDELDGADPNVALSTHPFFEPSGVVSTEAGDVAKHPKTAAIATANTWGTGASVQYMGRNQLDAATLDRFVASTLYVDYDRVLELKIASALAPGLAGEICQWAEGLRDYAAKNQLRRILSTRLIEGAARRVACGDSLRNIASDALRSWSDQEKAGLGSLAHGGSVDAN
jgi:MoxR-like ATPase